MEIKDSAVTANDPQNEIGKTRVRDETQKLIDQRVDKIAKAWADAKHPKPENAPAHAFEVAKTDVAGLKSMVRRAATLHKVHPVFFKDHKLQNGNIRVKFTVTHKPVKDDAAAKE